MVQIAILTGKTAGALVAARRFPFYIGRDRRSGLCLEEDGVWDRHARFELIPRKSFRIQAEEGALITVNGQPAQRADLRNGDLLGFGSVSARFWLAPAVQRPLQTREFLAWTGIAAVILGEIALMNWLLA